MSPGWVVPFDTVTTGSQHFKTMPQYRRSIEQVVGDRSGSRCALTRVVNSQANAYELVKYVFEERRVELTIAVLVGLLKELL